MDKIYTHNLNHSLISCIFYLLILCINPAKIFAQKTQDNKSTILTGRIISKEVVGIPYARVQIREAGVFTETKPDGTYQLNLKPGKYHAQISCLGYKTARIRLNINQGENLQQPLLLEAHDRTKIAEVCIEGKSTIRTVKESAFNVVVLDAKKFHNSPMELSDVLDRASGVKIRQNGGLGSHASVNLNGFSGRHVKVFIDGVPMQGMGSAFQINNIPVNLAERIEIYKGVVPIELGSDALGGAINIISNKHKKSYADLSYSLGSFNTHRSYLNLGYVDKKGFTFQINAFQNYSDNNYPVFTQIREIATSKMSEESHWTKAFHNKYHNETAIFKVGVVNTRWADQLLLGLTLGQEYAAIQNANIMKIVYGEKSRNATTLMPSLTYSKKDFLTSRLDFTLTGNYNRNFNQNVDTASREYNWYGEFSQRRTVGEAVNTLAEFNNENANASLNLVYKINDKHSISINDNWSTYERKNVDQKQVKDEFSIPDAKSSNYKNVAGLSYRYQVQRKWVSAIFAKHFVQSTTGMVNVGESISFPTYKIKTTKADAFGYGFVSTYFHKDFQYKVSIEKALRLPSATELLGDAVLERSNASLRPENSRNINVGISYQKDLNKDHAIFIDASGLYRDVKDFIQRQIVQRTGEAHSVNHGRVQNIGANFEGRYYYKNYFHIGGTLTYQSLVNKERYDRYDSAQLSQTYNDRMPNQPYFFANGEAELKFPHFGGKSNLLSLGYHFHYTHSFYLRWPSMGERGDKSTIDKAITHDLMATYAMKSGRYNVSIEGRNIADRRVYDNYSLQKPGRSFNLKLRYFFM